MNESTELLSRVVEWLRTEKNELVTRMDDNFWRIGVTPYATLWSDWGLIEHAKDIGWVDEFEEEDPIESLYHGNQIKLDDLVAHWESLGLSEFSHSLEMRNGAAAMKRRMLEELRQFVKVEAQNRSNKEKEIKE